ncbi:MAG: PadR family transcriptional regulator [Candidatus Latescibacteria bacterium]|nr:PadR family transcriptional regulator [Candidatus Latescibacterota bacterium]MBT4138877.1 PadR family transcriptional regulator [Candidatus Latescibacterota bacterium]MBT5828787.1 PadR family transcriptional regulator [Candidatus Latescibacterota bacterium]
MAGYDLKKIFDDSINFFWSAQTSQIYRELNALEKKGYVVSEIKPGDKGPDKRIYSITEEGQSGLKAWLLDVPDDIGEDNRNAFLLRVFLSSNVGIDELIFQMQKRLRKYKKDLQRLELVKSRLSEYAQMPDKERELPYWKITLSRGFHDVESHIKWAEESLAYLQSTREETT